MLNTPQVRRGLRRLLAGRPVPITSLASKTWVLCPEEERRGNPAVYLPNALDQIDALSPWRQWREELNLIEGGSVTHAASTAHLIEHVDLVDAYIYVGACKHKAGWGPNRWWLPAGRKRELRNSATLANGWSGTHFFGTLMLDDFPLGLIEEDPANQILLASRGYEHESGYRKLHRLPTPPVLTLARIQKLLLFTDFAQNSFKARRYDVLRERLRQTVVRDDSVPGIYIRRGQAGERRVLTNERDIEEFLASLGYVVIDPDQMSSQEIARSSLNTPVVVGVEGSQLSHAIYSAAEGATFLVLQPPDRFAMAYKEYTDRMEMRFAFLVGLPEGTGFSVPVDDIKRILEKLRV